MRESPVICWHLLQSPSQHSIVSKEPYRLVREAAEGAREALETDEFYHQDLWRVA